MFGTLGVGLVVVVVAVDVRTPGLSGDPRGGVSPASAVGVGVAGRPVWSAIGQLHSARLKQRLLLLLRTCLMLIGVLWQKQPESQDVRFASFVLS